MNAARMGCYPSVASLPGATRPTSILFSSRAHMSDLLPPTDLEKSVDHYTDTYRRSDRGLGIYVRSVQLGTYPGS